MRGENATFLPPERWKAEAGVKLIARLSRILSYQHIRENLILHQDDRVLIVEFCDRCSKYLRACIDPEVKFYSGGLQSTHDEFLKALRAQGDMIDRNMDIDSRKGKLLVPAIKRAQYEMSREEHERIYTRQYDAIVASREAVVKSWEKFSFAVKVLKDEASGTK